MTEREIPDGLGFLFGGTTDPSLSPSAPPVSSAPATPAPASTAAAALPVYSSRREARAAGVLAAGGPAAEAAPAPAYEGIASLFPLLGEVTSDPVTTALAAPSTFDAILAPALAPAPADLAATQAIPAAEIAAELATPVAPYVVPQSAPVPIVRSWHVSDSAIAGAAVAPAGAASGATTPAATVAPASDSVVAARRVHAAPARPSSRQRSGRSRGTVGMRPGARAVERHVASDGEPKPLRQRLFGVGVMVLVGGLFAVLALPAYADNNAVTLKAAAAVQTQKLSVAKAAASTVTTTTRDGYTATSAADLKALYAAAMREQNIAAYLQSGAKAKGDDYPWYAELDRAQGGGLSPLGYYYRECVDFVAWRLNRDAGTTSAPFKWTWSKLTPNGGDGHQWKAAWLAHGWPTGTTPVPGSVAWFGNNHVGYVNGILDNGQVLIEEYNYVPHAYGTRVINANQAYYLYAPPG